MPWRMFAKKPPKGSNHTPLLDAQQNDDDDDGGPSEGEIDGDNKESETDEDMIDRMSQQIPQLPPDLFQR